MRVRSTSRKTVSRSNMLPNNLHTLLVQHAVGGNRIRQSWGSRFYITTKIGPFVCPQPMHTVLMCMAAVHCTRPPVAGKTHAPAQPGHTLLPQHGHTTVAVEKLAHTF